MPKSEWKRMNKRGECVENDITLGEVCNTLRGVWSDAKRVAEGF